MTNGFVSYLKQLKIIAYCKPSAIRLRGVISQEGTCLNYRTGNGNDSNAIDSGLLQQYQHRHLGDNCLSRCGCSFHRFFLHREGWHKKHSGILHSQFLFLAINFCIFKVDLSFKKLILLIIQSIPLPQVKQTQGRRNLGGS